MHLPEEDPTFGSGLVGKLNVCLYGTRGAAKGWQDELCAHMLSLGFSRGVCHPAIVHNEARWLVTLLHGDDYVTAGEGAELD